jgi:hypothetical protein
MDRAQVDRTAAQKKHPLNRSSHSGDSIFAIPSGVAALLRSVTQKAALLANQWLLRDFQ